MTQQTKKSKRGTERSLVFLTQRVCVISRPSNVTRGPGKPNTGRASQRGSRLLPKVLTWSASSLGQVAFTPEQGPHQSKQRTPSHAQAKAAALPVSTLVTGTGGLAHVYGSVCYGSHRGLCAALCWSAFPSEIKMTEVSSESEGPLRKPTHTLLGKEVVTKGLVSPI